MNRVPEILAGLVPEFSDLPQEAKPVATAALRRAVLLSLIHIWACSSRNDNRKNFGKALVIIRIVIWLSLIHIYTMTI